MRPHAGYAKLRGIIHAPNRNFNILSKKQCAFQGGSRERQRSKATTPRRSRTTRRPVGADLTGIHVGDVSETVGVAEGARRKP